MRLYRALRVLWNAGETEQPVLALLCALARDPFNVRPFVNAGVLRAKFFVNWNKDRGTNPDGSERLNDLHFTRRERGRAPPIGKISDTGEYVQGCERNG